MNQVALYLLCRWAMLFALLIPCAALAQSQSRASMVSEPRVALVIGNSSYKVGPLKNPSNDSEDVAAALRGLGFRVKLRKDATQLQMVDSITEFGKELRKGGVGLFYFAGHGVQSKGNNFLIPINADVSSEAQLEFDAINATRVLSEMDSAGNRVNIMILDACRDNPFARSFRTTSRGLVAMEAAKGTYISFATGPGSVAADGPGRNGVYTEYLLKSLQQPESEVDRVFRRVAAEVSRATGGRQTPWHSHNLTGDFYFRLDGAKNATVALSNVTSVPQTDSRAYDRALWETVKDSNSVAELQSYLDQFPNGIFSGVARLRIKTLATAPPPVKVAASGSTEARSLTTGDLRVRLRSDSIKSMVREVMIFRDRGTATLAIDIENLSGEDLRLGIVRPFMIGTCQADRNNSFRGLPDKPDGGVESVDRSTLRWVRPGEKLLLSIESEITSLTCKTLMDSRVADISLMLIVSDGKQTIKYPLTAQAAVTHSQR